MGREDLTDKKSSWGFQHLSARPVASTLMNCIKKKEVFHDLKLNCEKAPRKLIHPLQSTPNNHTESD